MFCSGSIARSSQSSHFQISVPIDLHKFAIYVPEDDKGYDAAQLTKILNELGASEVKKVAEY